MLYRKPNPHLDRPRWMSEDRGLFPVQRCWRWSRSQMCVATMTKRPKSSGTTLEPAPCCTRGLASASATLRKGSHTFGDAREHASPHSGQEPGTSLQKAKGLKPTLLEFAGCFCSSPEAALGKAWSSPRAPERVRVGEGTDPVL